MSGIFGSSGGVLGLGASFGGSVSIGGGTGGGSLGGRRTASRSTPRAPSSAMARIQAHAARLRAASVPNAGTVTGTPAPILDMLPRVPPSSAAVSAMGPAVIASTVTVPTVSTPRPPGPSPIAAASVPFPRAGTMVAFTAPGARPGTPQKDVSAPESSKPEATTVLTAPGVPLQTEASVMPGTTAGIPMWAMIGAAAVGAFLLLRPRSNPRRRRSRRRR